MESELKILGNVERGRSFLKSADSGRFLFAMVMSYTATCEIPGITIAGKDTESFKFTPPADAEYIQYGHCRTIDCIPMTPDGKPTPAILTRTALESADIPHVAISAGSMIKPDMPYIETRLPHGGNIMYQDAMDLDAVYKAVDYGRIVGKNLAAATDCLVIGESIPGGTTTAMAVLHGLRIPARVSSSIPSSPVALKEHIVRTALARIGSRYMISPRSGNSVGATGGGGGDSRDIHGRYAVDGVGAVDGRDDDSSNSNMNRTGSNDNNITHKDSNSSTTTPDATHDNAQRSITHKTASDKHTYEKVSIPTTPNHARYDLPHTHSTQAASDHTYNIIAKVGDPMIPFVAGMAGAASRSSSVLLAGGTQMAAVLALALQIGLDRDNIAVGTTSYVADDPSADFGKMISRMPRIPALVVDPGLKDSKHAGLQAFAGGFAKEGAGAGGCIISAMLKTGMSRAELLHAADAEYKRLTSA